MAEPEKLDLKSMSITDDQKAKLKQLFPEVFNEDRIDFDKLKRTIGEEIDTGEERFGMTWPGKNDCFKVIQTPSVGTLKPAKEESINWDTTENLFIEGDNLEVLKLLQGAYYGKIKMIYIDPPYNTGKEFIYPDNYTESLETYLTYTGQRDEEGRKFTTNAETSGRFHSKWLNMMYPRLFLARNLLREDGLIFISIDDNEVKNLRAIMDEILGEENFISNIVWQKKYSPQNDAKYFSDSHEHLLLYTKDIASYEVGLLPRTEEANKRYKNPDNDPRGPWKSSDLTRQEYRPNDYYEIVSPATGKKFLPPKGNSWGRPKSKIQELIADNRIWFGPDGNSIPSLKRFLSEVKEGITPQTIWERKDVGDTQEGKKLIKEYFGNVSIYETAKPPRLIQRAFLTANVQNGDTILDFFAGSCSSAEAASTYAKSLKFIMVQLPEFCEEKSEPFKAGYKTIADIGKERIRRVIKKIQDEQTAKKKDAEGKLSGMAEENTKLDLGFKVFKLDKSNFNIWDGTVNESGDISDQIEMFIDHIDTNASDEDILYEILLKTRFPLTTKIGELQLAGKKVFSIADKALLICLDRKLSKEVITEMASLQPARIVCLDVGFADNDQLKTNAVQIMKSHGVEDFRTV